MTELNKIVSFLDRELKVSEFRDDSNNGLQVENSVAIRKICCGVDACMEFFEEARRRRADMVICHHGLSWGDSLKRITDINHRRISFLINNDMALYACHLPLDAHPRLGNNAQICMELGLRKLRRFGVYHGVALGYRGELSRAMKYDDFKKLVRGCIADKLRTMDFGKKMVKSVAVVSGAAGSCFEEACRGDVDVFLSGEPVLNIYNLARECRINAVFAGHYATEIFGVRAVGGLLAKRFRIPSEFIDLGIPL